MAGLVKYLRFSSRVMRCLCDESLEARVTKRVQEQAAHYKASAATLRAILDGLSEELGSDVRAAGLKPLVKTVLVHALDALADDE